MRDDGADVSPPAVTLNHDLGHLVQAACRPCNELRRSYLIKTRCRPQSRAALPVGGRGRDSILDVRNRSGSGLMWITHKRGPTSMVSSADAPAAAAMAVLVGINGFGRIGRSFERVVLDRRPAV